MIVFQNLGHLESILASCVVSLTLLRDSTGTLLGHSWITSEGTPMVGSTSSAVRRSLLQLDPKYNLYTLTEKDPILALTLLLASGAHILGLHRPEVLTLARVFVRDIICRSSNLS